MSHAPASLAAARTTPTAGLRAAAGLGLALALTPTALAQQELAGYFGFSGSRVVVVDDNAGPALVHDMNGDGLNDLVIVNNRKSRIEIHAQREQARTDREMERDLEPNELPPSRWFDRSEVSVSHRISAFRVHDADADGRPDILYAGQPSEIVVMSQTEPMTFEQDARRRVRGIAAGQDGFHIANVTGDASPELLVVVAGKIHIYDLSADGPVGEPIELGSGGDLVAFFVEDYDGDGMQDILGVIPDADAPLRLWLQERTGPSADPAGSIGPELRFEMPPLIEVEPIRLPDQDAAAISVIERQSRRMVLYDLTKEVIEPIAEGGMGVERDALVEVSAFRGDEDKDRDVAVADIDGDGLLDMLATDTNANGIVLHRQRRGTGLGRGELFSAFKEPKAVAAGQWDGQGPLEVFVLSEEEKTLGVSSYNERTGRLSFPTPISIATAGAEPVAMVPVADEQFEFVVLAVVVRDRRDHTLELHRPDGGVLSVELEDVNRPPQSMLAGDFNADGDTDILLFTPNEPLVMVSPSPDKGPEGTQLNVLTDEDMPQFGLVQAAGPNNTAKLDIDNDGSPELLIADENFVRAAAFDSERGWRVVEQITTPDATSSLEALTVVTLDLGNRTTDAIVAADTENERLVVMARDAEGAWRVADMLRLGGVDPIALRAGAFAGDGKPGILALTPDAFGLVRLAGQRVALEEFAVHRSDDDDLFEHEIEAGDVNGDGYTDVIVLDAQEQKCIIFSLSAARRLVPAMDFKVFEQRLFAGGGGRTFEPSAAILDDITGDGETDLILQIHDRYLIYPQATR